MSIKSEVLIDDQPWEDPSDKQIEEIRRGQTENKFLSPDYNLESDPIEDPVKQYLNEISDAQLLSSDEEILLAQYIELPNNEEWFPYLLLQFPQIPSIDFINNFYSITKTWADKAERVMIEKNLRLTVSLAKNI